MKINEKILLLRKKEGLSGEALAEKLNVSRQTISNWERGETSPDLSQAVLLSKVFKVSLDDLTDNKLELETKDDPNNILKSLIGKKCILLVDDDYMDGYIDSNKSVLVQDVSNSFIKVECKKGKEVINKLIDIDIITSIKVLEEENK